ncbi:MAG: glycosyltransferase [Saprospiraceae bacterium]
MVKFTHYLVTRFNVPVEGWNKDKGGQPILDETWMKHRLSLFKTYCMPTIQHQTTKNFQWIIYCDKNTSAAYMKQIEDWIKNIPAKSVRQVSDLTELMSDLRKLISKTDTPFVITTRLDNDDGLGRNTMQIIQEHFKEKDLLLLNFLSGIVYDTRIKVITEIKKGQQNHYTSLIEMRKPAEQMITVLGFAHDNPPPAIMIENLSAKSAWLKIIHEKNMKSRLKGKPVFKSNSNYFEAIPNSKFPLSHLNTLKYIVRRVLQKTGDHLRLKRR